MHRGEQARSNVPELIVPVVDMPYVEPGIAKRYPHIAALLAILHDPVLSLLYKLNQHHNLASERTTRY